jgi:hypothetical protein
MRATLGLTVSDYIITDEEMGVGIALSPGGASWGNIKSTGTLLRAAKKLVKAGCTAIAVVARFPDDGELLIYTHTHTHTWLDLCVGMCVGVCVCVTSRGQALSYAQPRSW